MNEEMIWFQRVLKQRNNLSEYSATVKTALDFFWLVAKRKNNEGVLRYLEEINEKLKRINKVADDEIKQIIMMDKKEK